MFPTEEMGLIIRICSSQLRIKNYGILMKQDNVIQEKSFAFAIRMVNLYKYLCEEKKIFSIKK
jgi:hypothetical protein